MAREPDFALTVEELRAVAIFAYQSAVEALPLFEAAVPDDDRPRKAVEAAKAIVDGEQRSRLQRLAAPAAHRAAKETNDPAAFHTAMACGDAAVAVYLHPLADVDQVSHILRASAHAALAVAVAGVDACETSLMQAAARATPMLRDVLSRYPGTSPGATDVGRAMHALDVMVRRD